MKSLIKKIWSKFSYQIEVLTQLLLVCSSAITYGIIEAKWIPTNQMGADELQIFGHFSYYHVCLLIMMFLSSIALSLSHLRWIISNRKRYLLWMAAGSLPLALMLEDLTWFVVMGQTIGANEWTMLRENLGINLFGWTWIPLWYIIVWLFSGSMFWLASRSAKKGHDAFLEAQKEQQ